MFSAEDYQYMAKAIQLANKPLQAPHPNPRVGCVIVKNNQIIGEGFHQKAGEPHAEVHALNMAGEQAIGATAYVTLEPCAHTGKTPPCANALVKAKVDRVVVAMQDPNPKVAGKGLDILRQAGISVESGLLQEQAEKLNRGFIKRMQTGIPWVRVKMAMSVDGRTAMANGESQWITGSAARQDVQRWRANADAILTGSGTANFDNPKLTVRDLPLAEIRQPLRVIVDSELKVAIDSQLFDEPGKIIVATTQAANSSNYKGSTEILQLPSVQEHIDLKALLLALGEREINEVHVEAGAILNGALLSANLVDEIVIYMAPILMGHLARPLFTLENIRSMQDKYLLECTDIRQIGSDTRYIFRRVK